MGIVSRANGPPRDHCTCLRRNGASVNRQGYKPLEIARPRHLSRNAAKVEPQ